MTTLFIQSVSSTDSVRAAEALGWSHLPAAYEPVLTGVVTNMVVESCFEPTIAWNTEMTIHIAVSRYDDLLRRLAE